MAEYTEPLENEYKLTLVINIGGKDYVLSARGWINDLPRLADVAACLARAGQHTINERIENG